MIISRVPILPASAPGFPGCPRRTGGDGSGSDHPKGTTEGVKAEVPDQSVQPRSNRYDIVESNTERRQNARVCFHCFLLNILITLFLVSEMLR